MLLQFRHTSQPFTSDELGIFLKNVLRENNIDHREINKIAVCSVVPFLDYSIRSACKKYFSMEPFILQVGTKTGLKIKYRDPTQVGTDRIANAIAATDLYPNRNLIIVDYGTATTFCIISAKKEYLGGLIMPGLQLAMDALREKAAKLPPVQIIKTETIIGRSTTESIQSGLYFSSLGATREIINLLKSKEFQHQEVTILATGGFAYLFQSENLFTDIIPSLALQGLKIALSLNGHRGASS